MVDTSKVYYGVSQSCHGHEYRFIFSEEELVKEIGEELLREGEEGSIDIHFPIGGSNSSATSFENLPTIEDARAFLTSPADGPDLEDPELVDIAEYLLTIETNEGCAGEFLKEFGLDAEDLTQYDDAYHHMEEAERMICHLLIKGCDKIDADNPFYGESSDMRFSELCELYEEMAKKLAYENMGKETSDIGFEFDGAWVTNPFMETTGRFEFADLEAAYEYYGEENVHSFLNKLFAQQE